MAFTIRLTNFTGAEQLTQVENTTSIFEFKNFLKNLYLTDDIYIFKNSSEIKEDTIRVVCKLKAGFDITKANEAKVLYENYTKTITELQSLHSDLNLILQNYNEINPPLELLEEDYEKPEMRTLFQRCRDQIEDEYKKMKQTEKENERTKRKIEELKIKMNQKKNKNKKTLEPKKTFCGFKKGFLFK